MGWSIGFDDNWNRDIGYGVPAWCDHPDCSAVIDRGLAYVCGGAPYGERDSDDGRSGCGLFFCDKHGGGAYCSRCYAYKPPRKRIKPEHPRWLRHKLKDESWQEWRDENPEEVAAMKAQLSVETPKRNKLKKQDLTLKEPTSKSQPKRRTEEA